MYTVSIVKMVEHLGLVQLQQLVHNCSQYLSPMQTLHIYSNVHLLVSTCIRIFFNLYILVFTFQFSCKFHVSTCIYFLMNSCIFIYFCLVNVHEKIHIYNYKHETNLVQQLKLAGHPVHKDFLQ